MNKYTLGHDQLPLEISKYMMTFQTASGDCGYEYYGKFRNYVGYEGDLLIVDGAKIYICRDYLEPP
jgi:hypothetical protein